MLKLYTKNNCQPCSNVKAYLETRPDLQVEIINCNDNPERIADFYDQYKTFPCLQKDDGSFMAQSEKILEYFVSLPGQMFKPSATPEYFWAN